MKWPPRAFQRPVWIWRIAWRYHTGRWYIFRDVPDWFLAESLICWGVDTLQRLALEEYLLRLNRRLAEGGVDVRITSELKQDS